MTKSNITNQARAELLANLLGDNFLRLAKGLRDLKNAAPDQFIPVIKLAGIHQRKAYALARISQQFEDLGIPEGRLYLIGWTKLQVIGRYLTKENGEQLLQLAEQNTVHDLEVLLRGEVPIEDAKVLTFYLAQGDYELLRKALLKFGAEPTASGLINKEEALMGLVESAIK